MKTQFNFLICILMILSLIGCTDEISEEVKNSDTLSESEEEALKFVGKSIRLVSTADEDSSHFLHKAGDVSADCELASPTLGFSSLDYDKENSAYTVDCILDVQENDLYFDGASVQLQVDEFLCEYTEYEPYRFFAYQPGETLKTQYLVSCDSACSEDTTIGQFCGRTYKTTGAVYDSSGNLSAANTNSSLTVDGSNNKLFTIDSTDLNIGSLFTNEVANKDLQYCRFDYTDVYTKKDGSGGPNCDEGIITTIPVQINSIDVDEGSCSDTTYTTEATCEANMETWTANIVATCDNSVNPTMFIDSANETEYECGGQFASCLAGPGSEDFPDGSDNHISIPNEDSSEFTFDLNLSAPYDLGQKSNMWTANFSRICSSTSLTKTNAEFDTTLNTLLGYEVEDLVDKYDYESVPIDVDGDGEFDYYPLGKHLFNGHGFYSWSAANVNPYYAFKCLDQARDTKAQIRLFIREWDRSFSEENAYIGRLSDINQTTSLMDSDGFQVVGERWNDYYDLDDLLSNYDFSTPYYSDEDYDNDGSIYDEIFHNNQCTGLKHGRCFQYTETDSATCTGGPLNGSWGASSGVWYRKTCRYDLDLIIDEESCLATDSNNVWALEYCSDTQFLNQEDCENASETWFSSDSGYPRDNL